MNWDVVRTVMCLVGAIVLGISLCDRAYQPFMGWWMRRQQRRCLKRPPFDDTVI